jgi:competence protein ComEC
MKRLCALALLAAALLTGCGGKGALPPLTVTFFAVGKADCILLETEGHAAMIDTGHDGDADDILAALSQKGISSLDFLLLTHMDKDHIGGADAIIDQMQIGTIYAPNYVKDNKQYDQYIRALDAAGIAPVSPSAALTLPFGSGTLTLLPGAKAEYEQSNDYSILAELQYGDTSFLFAGDAEAERLGEYLAGSPRAFDVLKVPHHGRADEMSEAFFTVVSPQYAVITCDEKNMPDESVVNFLKSLGAEVHGTVYGDVVLTSDGRTVKTA